ncbi:MAG: hypothetical protein K2N48_13160 [Muribaculaceae bacterium]|nr:hypothetical protein [Muribaculaceae bacterium]
MFNAEFAALLIIGISAFIALGIIAFGLYKFGTGYLELKRIEVDRQTASDNLHKQMDELGPKIMKARVDASHAYIEHIQYLISETAVLKFQTFVSEHDMKKINKSHAVKLIEDVVNEVRNSLGLTDTTDYSVLLTTKEFIDHHIISTASNAVRKLLEDYIAANQND